MYTPLRLGNGNPLNTVYTTFILQCTVYISTCNGAYNFLETARCTFTGTRDLKFPAFLLGIFRIHSEEVSCKQCSFVTSGTASNFQYCILAVFWVFRYKHQLDFLFQRRDSGLASRNFLACHLFHLWIAFCKKDILTLFKVSKKVGILLSCLHKVFEFLIFTSKTYKSLLIRNHIRVCNECRNFLETRSEIIKLIQQTIFS